ncbi:iron-containing redox enzyme family protein [Streptomyces sp. NPDC003006]
MAAVLDQLDQYEARAEAGRKGFAEHPAVRELGSPRIDVTLFAQWHYRYCLHGVHVTQDMQRVIEAAGTRSRAAGHASVGEGLIKHARGETGHDRLMVHDARSMVPLLADKGGTVLDTEGILADAPALASAARYNALFERLSGGEDPVCTVAALYEMEQLSAGFAIELVANCKRAMGDDPSRFTFLDEHVVVDVGHIALDRRMLERALTDRPHLLDAMVEAGIEVLASYAEFVGECLELARADLAMGRGR